MKVKDSAVNLTTQCISYGEHSKTINYSYFNYPFSRSLQASIRDRHNNSLLCVTLYSKGFTYNNLFNFHNNPVKLLYPFTGEEI